MPDRKKKTKVRSSVQKDFFTSGLSRKGHSIPSNREYNRKKVRRDTAGRITEVEKDK